MALKDPDMHARNWIQILFYSTSNLEFVCFDPEVLYFPNETDLNHSLCPPDIASIKLLLKLTQGERNCFENSSKSPFKQ